MTFAVFWHGFKKHGSPVRGTTIVQAESPSRARYEVAVDLMAKGFVSLAFPKTKKSRCDKR